jgi:hypothetical protein
VEVVHSFHVKHYLHDPQPPFLSPFFVRAMFLNCMKETPKPFLEFCNHIPSMATLSFSFQLHYLFNF